MDYPSPRGVHVPETYYASDPDDPYHRPPAHRNRYSRSTGVHQTPQARNVTWFTSSDPATPQMPYAPPTPWLPQQMPSTPAHRPPSAIPPSPAPTVGEHMTVDDIAFTQDDLLDPYHLNQVQRPSLFRSFWRGLKRQFSGIHPDPPFPMPRPSSTQGVGMPMPMPTPGMPMPMPMPMTGPSEPSEESQYVNPTPPGTAMATEERNATPHSTPYVRPTNIIGTPATTPGSLRRSPAPSMRMAPPITVISPSPPSTTSSPSPTSIRSVRMPSPRPALRRRPVGMPEPGPAFPEVGSRTPRSAVHADTALPPLDLPLNSAPIAVAQSPPRDTGIQALPVERASSKGSLSSTLRRFRRFVAELDDLPWSSDTQIADEYIPDQNPRSRMRTSVRQGAEPSWYNERPEMVQRPEYWSEWDMWAKQSAAALWDGTAGGDRRVGWAGVGAGGLGQGQFPRGLSARQGSYPFEQARGNIELFPRSQPQHPEGFAPPPTQDPQENDNMVSIDALVIHETRFLGLWISRLGWKEVGWDG
ncbi:hypothetical protein HD554DRAFT_2177796 [Boletus coccyginus]|nr:hypothetical protein HD554DRAFT_2177796 [Boletus coccyginus]